MRTLVLTLVALATLMLSACSSCLGRTPTPGEAAPQAEAPDNTLSMLSTLDSLLNSGDGEALYANMSSIYEKVIAFEDAAKAKACLDSLHHFFLGNEEQIASVLAGISNTEYADDARKLADSFAHQPVDELLLSLGYTVDSAETNDTDEQ